MTERSKAKKREAKLRLKNWKFKIFSREASFSAFSFAALSHFLQNLSWQLIGPVIRKG